MKRYWINGADVFGLELENKEDCGPNDVASREMDTDDPKKPLNFGLELVKNFLLVRTLWQKQKQMRVYSYERLHQNILQNFIVNISVRINSTI